eukprot:254764-Chlamydomonas_euryale.AAC.2
MHAPRMKRTRVSLSIAAAAAASAVAAAAAAAGFTLSRTPPRAVQLRALSLSWPLYIHASGLHSHPAKSSCRVPIPASSRAE